MAEKSFTEALRWAFVMNLGQQGAQSLIALVLAALLGPEAFGLVAMALVYLEFFQLFLGQGLSGALIQRRNLEARDLDTAFWVVTASTLALVALAALAAPYWAEFNRTPQLAWVSLALAPMLLFRGLGIVHEAHLQKSMDFKSLAIRSNVAVTLGGVAGLGLALTGFGLWALVAQQLLTSLVQTLLLWLLSDWKPRARFSRATLREMRGFARQVLLNRLGIFAHRRSDAIVLGYFFGPVALAIYRMAERLVQLLIEVSTRPVAQVSLPSFARIQADPQALRRGVTNALKTSSILGVPALVGLAAVSDPLIGVLGDAWADAAPVLRILCVFGMVRTMTLFTGSLLQAVGRPGLLAGSTWALAAANVTGFVLAGFWLQAAPVLDQTRGIAWMRTGIYALLYTPPFLAMLLYFSGASVADLLRAVRPALLGAAAVVAAVSVVDALTADLGLAPGVTLVCEALVGGAAGLGLLYAIDADFRTQIAAPLRWLQRRAAAVVPAEDGHD